METVHIISGFLINLLRDPACATLLAIGSFLITIRPARSTRSQQKCKRNTQNEQEESGDMAWN